MICRFPPGVLIAFISSSIGKMRIRQEGVVVSDFQGELNRPVCQAPDGSGNQKGFAGGHYPLTDIPFGYRFHGDREQLVGPKRIVRCGLSCSGIWSCVKTIG